jgi:hypothetical protein
MIEPVISPLYCCPNRGEMQIMEIRNMEKNFIESFIEKYWNNNS